MGVGVGGYWNHRVCLSVYTWYSWSCDSWRWVYLNTAEAVIHDVGCARLHLSFTVICVHMKLNGPEISFMWFMMLGVLGYTWVSLPAGSFKSWTVLCRELLFLIYISRVSVFLDTVKGPVKAVSGHKITPRRFKTTYRSVLMFEEKKQSITHLFKTLSGLD